MSRQDFDAKIEKAGLVVGCVIQKEDTFLLVQQNSGKVAGLWNLPAGYVDKGESLEQAAAREVKEECGLDVQVGDLIGVWHTETTESVKHAFRAEVIGGNVVAQPDEVQAVEWFSYAQIKELNAQQKLRAAWVFEAITKLA